jgi:hypothetical protein
MGEVFMERASCLIAAWLYVDAIWGVAALAADPRFLISSGNILYRVGGAEPSFVEVFPDQPGTIIGMTVVPPEAEVAQCGDGAILAIEASSGSSRVWRVDRARFGTPSLTLIGRLPTGKGANSITFRSGRLFGIANGGIVREYDTSTFAQIGPDLDIDDLANSGPGSISFDPTTGTWFTLGADQGDTVLLRYADPLTPQGRTVVGPLGLPVSANGFEFYEGTLWVGMRTPDSSVARLEIGIVNTVTGAYSRSIDVAAAPAFQNVGFVAFTPLCTGFQGDADRDNLVSFSDISTVLSTFGNAYLPGTGLGDANWDSVVNFADITSVLGNYGNFCL